MASSQSIVTSSFLEDCISKKKRFQDIYEPLGLFSESSSARREPTFVKEDANAMQKKIIEMAKLFRTGYHDDQEGLKRRLMDSNALSGEVQQLADQYGHSLWEGDQNPDLRWENDEHQKLIRFHIRCWISRHTVNYIGATPRKGKGRVGGRPNGLGGDARLNLQTSRMIWSSANDSLWDQAFGASVAPPMLPHTETTRTSAPMATNTEAVDSWDDVTETESDSANTPTKRKATSERQTPGKLQKVQRKIVEGSKAAREQRQDVYALPGNPASATYPIRPTFPVQRAREDTCDTDGTYVPQRATTNDTETIIDEDEVMLKTPEFLSPAVMNQVTDDTFETRSVTAGPSGTYHNPNRSDSVIPADPEHDSGFNRLALYTDGSGLDCPPENVPEYVPEVARSQMQVPKPEEQQQEQLRRELFTLLLSYLNKINQFENGSFEPDIEERMNYLLYHFSSNDGEVLCQRLGEDLKRSNEAFNTWMKMRHELSEFRITTGYMGGPGDDWKNHLRRMERVSRAKSGIAFVMLKSSIDTEGKPWLEETFNNDLMVVFDLLTRIEGCNGPEEFTGLRQYNESLLEWFQ